LRRLRTLSVCHCGLEDLDGVSYVSNIVNLCAADNQISDAYPITELRKIHTLDLENNEFDEYGSISFLFICPKLENLVLKGNPISYDVDYRATIFRILPGLKNLDVITMKRVSKTICKKDTSPNEDDDFEGTASNGIPAPDSDLKELENVYPDKEQTKNKEEPPDPLDEQLIQTLMNQKSDDETSGSNDDAENEPEPECEPIEDPPPELLDNQTLENKEEYEEKEEEESLSISLSKASEVSDELFIPEIMENKKEDFKAIETALEEDIPSSAAAQATAFQEKRNQHQPVIMDRPGPKESPTQQQQQISRLLNRRKSLDPVRFREIKRELFGSEEFSLKLDDDQPPPPPPVTKKEPTTPTDPNCGFTPNLAHFIKTSDKPKQVARPDSSMSFSSTTTYSHSISEADSGLGDVGPLTSSCSSNSCSSSSSSMKRPVESSFPRLESRTGTGLKVTSPKVETPSKRTKKTDKAKLLRTNSDLHGKLTTEGDVEVEDFD